MVALKLDFADVTDRVQSVVRRVAPHDAAERHTRLGADVIAGAARITSASAEQ